MPNFTFDRLLVRSDINKSANQFKFQSRFNLITGIDNSIGKSSLAKLLLWSMGCDPDFDIVWKEFKCKTLVEITVNQKKYWIARDSEKMLVSDDGRNFTAFSNITGLYSEWFAQLTNFSVLLPSRKDNTKLEAPPPAYYFLPFYIDQIRSWSRPWQGFDNLGQYADWQSTVIKYHTGYLSPQYFEYEAMYAEKKSEEKLANAEIQKIDTAIEVVEEYLPQSNLAITDNEFDELTKEINIDLSELQHTQERLFTEIAKLQADKYHFANQLLLVNDAAKAFEEDYKFSVENIYGEELKCPLCGVIHDNSIVSRSSLLADKQEAESQAAYLEKKLRSTSDMLNRKNKELVQSKQKIELINIKYNESQDYGNNSLTRIVEGLAAISVKRNVAEFKTAKQSLVKELVVSQKNIKKEQKKLSDPKEKKGLDDEFINRLNDYLNALNVKDVNLSTIKGPLDYKKLFGIGGAAESTRGLLAYQLAVFKQIYLVGSEIVAPFIIDTPNQHEQAKINYSSILELLMNATPSDTQVILCAMDSPNLKTYIKNAKVNTLDGNKVLKKENYLKIQSEMSSILGQYSE